VNWLCTIIEEQTGITDDDGEIVDLIKCLTPEVNNDPSYGSPVNIHVTTNFREESVTECASSAVCTFQYLDLKTPIQNLPAEALNEEI